MSNEQKRITIEDLYKSVADLEDTYVVMPGSPLDFSQFKEGDGSASFYLQRADQVLCWMLLAKLGARVLDDGKTISFYRL